MLSLLREDGVFPPGEEFRKRAAVYDESIYGESLRDREGFWEKQAGQLNWFKRWEKVLEWDPPHARWFVNGKINVSFNCLTGKHVPILLNAILINLVV